MVQSLIALACLLAGADAFGAKPDRTKKPDAPPSAPPDAPPSAPPDAPAPAFIEHEGVGWCSSNLDDVAGRKMWDGEVSAVGDKTVDDCMTACQVFFSGKISEPRHLFLSKEHKTGVFEKGTRSCFCQDGCTCMRGGSIGSSTPASTLAPDDWTPPSQCLMVPG